MQSLKLLTVKEVSRRLGISQPTLLKHVHAGELPAVKIGCTVRVPEVVVERLVADCVAQLDNRSRGLVNA